MKKIIFYTIFAALLSFAFYGVSFLFSTPLCKTLAHDCNDPNIEHYFNEDIQTFLPDEEFSKTNSDTVPSRNYTVVIDPGHGGTDPGSIGYKTKVHEDKLNLKMSKLLKNKLESAGINVVMTRTDNNAEPMKAPITWKIMYIPASFPLIRPLKRQPKVMAGLMWQPLIPPMVYAIATTAKPKAIAVPTTDAGSTPQLRLTAVPQPISTKTIVPIISAKYFFITRYF